MSVLENMDLAEATTRYNEVKTCILQLSERSRDNGCLWWAMIERLDLLVQARLRETRKEATKAAEPSSGDASASPS